MGVYESFASVYDTFMGETDYDGWVSYIEKIWERENLSPEIVLDLGCGTGNVTERLAKKGYDMIGIDLSEDMLAKARDKAYEENLDILYLCQDMREFELYGTVNCILSLFDSLNYITDEDDLLKVFKLVNNYLHPKGLFIFDMNTEYKFKNIYADNTYAETTENAAYIWENFYDEEEKINEYYMNFFIEDEETGTYERFEECHYEKAYSIDIIKNLIEESGMQFVAVYDAYTFEPAREDSERIFVVAREITKCENQEEK
ncbi:SAM-dependent methyltransferase [Tyzzerella sp. An114]|uniref:class I SAM-dependent DNA methyltransferase n=1 Tax=Tyzzerella sp. An114 TaxID=1965545 RepID=UPI000B451A6C|nr:class I SAM-dependent methyltransferase [Tyzzerella sp. An114]OUQ58888.1 SAM-dependent methyltransferase [Tyzzerella sp. An114]